MNVERNKVIASREELPASINNITDNIQARILYHIKILYNKKYHSYIDKKYFSSAYNDLSRLDGKFQNEITNKGTSVEAMIQTTGHTTLDETDSSKNFLKLAKEVWKEIKEGIYKDFQCKLAFELKDKNILGFDFYTSPEVAKSLWKQLIDKSIAIKESSNNNLVNIKSSELLDNLANEFYCGHTYTSDKAKSRLVTLANVVSNLLLPKNQKIFIQIKPNWTKTVKFKFPDESFPKRFLDGRETLANHCNQEKNINITISDDIFRDAKESKSIIEFFNSIISHWNQLDEKADMVFNAFNMLDKDIKAILLNVDTLRPILRYLFQLIMVYRDFDINEKDCFKVNPTHIALFVKFIGNCIAIKGNKSKEEKALDILREMYKELGSDLNSDLNRFIMGLEKYYQRKYDEKIAMEADMRIESNCIRPEERRFYQESFTVKRLKKLPRDIVTYITIETENITTNNDKMMIASYCISKLEICEWYIALLNTESKKFIVPHDKPYLDWMRTELLRCYKNIMNTKVVNPAKRPIIDIQYPEGYEG